MESYLLHLVRHLLRLRLSLRELLQSLIRDEAVLLTELRLLNLVHCLVHVVHLLLGMALLAVLVV